MEVSSRQKSTTYYTFGNKLDSLFRKHPYFTNDIETEWDLYKSAVKTSTAARNMCAVKLVIRKKLVGGNKKLKSISVQKSCVLSLINKQVI